MSPATASPAGTSNDLAGTGIAGLDYILGGGLPRRRLYLVQGDPGVGKTTLALQFLLEGVRRGERSLYITLSETLDEMQAVLQSHGWAAEGLDIFEMDAREQALSAHGHNTLFHPGEAQLGEVTKGLRAHIDRVKPSRVAFDSLSEVRLMAADPLRYRREILTLKAEFAERDSTVLLLDDRTAGGDDQQLQSLAHGVISLRRESPAFGPARRRVEVQKLRGVHFRDGLHDFKIVHGGIQVFPRMISAEHREHASAELMTTGNRQLDVLLGGGLDRGSSILLLGPAGIGKSTTALSCAIADIRAGGKAALFSFDESINTLVSRAAGLGLNIKEFIKNRTLRLQKIDPAEFTPGQFANLAVDVVREEGFTTILIDGLNGYLNAMPRDEHLMLHLHELLAILNSLRATVLIVVAQHGVIGMSMTQPVDVSYLADTVLLFRYYEFEGEVRQALSVFKRRGGAHERTIRELRLGPPNAIHVGESLRDFRGVLTGVPTYHGDGKRE
jgi:circadian clock protein KaiC